MTLVKFAPERKENVLNPWFNDVFKSYFNDTLSSDKVSARVPAVNISETAGDFSIELAAPGLKKEDFKISVEKNVLSISADNKSEKNGEGRKYNRIEYSYSSFVRSFTLPESVDYSKIDASYTDGILNVHIAKKEEAKFQSREISVK